MTAEVEKNELNLTENIAKATEVVFCFDTTGSMSPCIANVRAQLEKTVEEMFELVPNLKVGFIAHGDYCDGPNCYRVLQLTDTKKEIYNFVRTTPSTGGGDEPECYELALHLAKSMGWSDNKGGKILVMIGDASPHDVNYPQNTDHLDWKKELTDLKEMGIDVYPLQCLYSQNRHHNNDFWSAIAETHNTPLMQLGNMGETAATLTGLACASSGSESFGMFESKCLDEEAKGLVGYSSEFKTRNVRLRSIAKSYDSTKNKKVPEKND